MQFNITFFLQIFNFAITYWFLNKFMFKPTISFIEKRLQKDNKIKKDLEKKEQVLLKLEKKKNNELHEFKFEMKQKYTVEEIEEPAIPSEVIGIVDKIEAKDLERIAKKILVERVPHVD